MSKLLETSKTAKIVQFAGECSVFQQFFLENHGFSVFFAIGAVEMGGTRDPPAALCKWHIL